MATKSALNHDNCHVSQPAPLSGIDLNPHPDFETLPGPAVENGGHVLPDDYMPEDYLSDPELQEMLESNDYRVALISASDAVDPQGSVGPHPPVAPALLLPFSWRELLTRIHEFFRESNGSARRRVAQFADVCVDFIKMEVCRMSGEVITLTKQEFKTLKCFLSNPDRVFSRDELLNEAWGYENYPSTRTVDNHVLKLRQKLERDPARPVHFLTVHRVGYKFVP